MRGVGASSVNGSEGKGRRGETRGEVRGKGGERGDKGRMKWK